MSECKLTDWITVALPSGSTVEVSRSRSEGSVAAWERYADALRDGRAFKASKSLCGAPVRGWLDMGRLAEAWMGSVERADYVVWSHSTPIAWRVPGIAWVIPAPGTLTYEADSSTIRMHMDKVRAAIESFSTYQETPPR